MCQLLRPCHKSKNTPPTLNAHAWEGGGGESSSTTQNSVGHNDNGGAKVHPVRDRVGLSNTKEL